MKRSSALLLQVAIVLIGLGVLAALLGEPHVEGRNAHASLFQIYFHDPFLAYVYAGSIPFFLALGRAFGLLGNFRERGTFTAASLEALGAIKRCAIALLGFVAGGVVIILMFGDPDDRPAGFFMSLLVASTASLIAVGAAWFARKLQRNLG